MAFEMGLINGMGVGIEFLGPDDEDFIKWVVVLDIFIIRLAFVGLK